MLKIEDLVVTQNGFRNPDQIQEMVAYVADGGIFDTQSLSEHSDGRDVRLINLVKFEDGRIFIHDGHHRVAAIYLGGRKFLSSDEYTIKSWKYEDYKTINFQVGWVTPYDPRIEVRIPDYFFFKEEVARRLESSEAEARWFINDCWQCGDYTSPRKALTIQDLLRYI